MRSQLRAQRVTAISNTSVSFSFVVDVPSTKMGAYGTRAAHVHRLMDLAASPATHEPSWSYLCRSKIVSNSLAYASSLTGPSPGMSASSASDCGWSSAIDASVASVATT